MTALPMFGMPMNPMMMRMGQRGQRPWVFISELKQDYEVKQIQMDVDKIDDDVQVLIVAHPKNITDKAENCSRCSMPCVSSIAIRASPTTRSPA